MLIITAFVTKLKPFIIFKGKAETRLFNNLPKLTPVLKGPVVVKTQENIWMTVNLFYKYIKEVLPNYYPNKKKLLILDQYPAYNSEKILYLLDK